MKHSLFSKGDETFHYTINLICMFLLFWLTHFLMGGVHPSTNGLQVLRG